MNADTLIQEAEADLSLLSRLVVGRAMLQERNGMLVLGVDQGGARLLTMDRVRHEIESAVERVWGMEVAYERA
ncbi:hypothetical protein ACSEE7_20085 [Halomonas cupida]|uniref:hypothetical protein n=1 Tax=Halomonas cupida TaxID=44933 RepID=UPI003EF8BB0D